MTAPIPYKPATSFQGLLGTTEGTDLDAEFTALQSTIAQIIANMGVMQRSDLALNNGVVTPDSLSAATKLLVAGGWNPTGAWATGKAYNPKDVISQNGIAYVCGVAHVSSTFTADQSSGYWVQIGGAAASANFIPSGLLTKNNVQDELTEIGQFLSNRTVVSVADLGAIPNVGTSAQAQANTAAFRKACRSFTSDWNNQVASGKSLAVYVPPGDWYLSNGFSLPAGVTLVGSGVGATRLHINSTTLSTTETKLPIVSMGVTLNSDLTISTSTGVFVSQPAPQIENIYIIHESAGTCIDVQYPGFKIDSVWLNAQTALNIHGSSDGIVSNLVFDGQTGQGIVLNNTQGCVFSNLDFYLTNYPVVFSTEVSDCIFSNCIFDFTTYASISTSDNGTDIRGNKFVGCTFVSNAQYNTFDAHIQFRASQDETEFTNCTFRNMWSYAVDLSNGTNHQLVFNNCVFDGAKTRPDFTQSTNALGLRINNSEVTLNHCTFRNLNGVVANVGGTYQTTVRFKGCVIENCPTSAPSVNLTNTNSNSLVVFEDIDGNGSALYNPQNNFQVRSRGLRNCWDTVNGSSYIYLKIPFQQQNIWRISITADTNPPGGVNYRAAASWIVAKQNAYSGSAVTSYLNSNPIFNTVVGTTPGQISPLFTFTSPNGPTSVAKLDADYLYAAVPNSYGFVSWDVEELI